ncbi:MULTISPECIES: hypothetical protein [Xanthomonas]|uniref:hypothetical protein n=1 Tax=Xanthomonas TaxID=338 RepID=UPI0018831D69|nr:MULTISPECIES: hypothetical protein [Xanthomonas]QOX05574.1 hypothetical protein IG630_23080 [Xanthomonas sp. WG16]QXF04366.1 hypothetical protein KJA71_23095 [Xanthomonas citri pv. citri]
MSGYLVWLVLKDGVCERIVESDIDAAEEAAVIDRVLIPITNSEIGLPRGRDSGYTVVGEVSGKYALLRLLDESAPLADIGVCLHSRAAPGLWARLLAGSDDAASHDRPGSVPWCAIRCYATEHVLPTWFDGWTKTVGMALMRREGW